FSRPAVRVHVERAGGGEVPLGRRAPRNGVVIAEPEEAPSFDAMLVETTPPAGEMPAQESGAEAPVQIEEVIEGHPGEPTRERAYRLAVIERYHALDVRIVREHWRVPPLGH